MNSYAYYFDPECGLEDEMMNTVGLVKFDLFEKPGLFQ